MAFFPRSGAVPPDAAVSDFRGTSVPVVVSLAESTDRGIAGTGSPVDGIPGRTLAGRFAVSVQAPKDARYNQPINSAWHWRVIASQLVFAPTSRQSPPS